MAIIQSLIDEGALVLFHDYRSGTYQDYSGNGNVGVPTNTTWQNNGIRPYAGGYILANDSPELQGTDVSLVMFADFNFQAVGTNQRLIGKRDAGGIQYSYYIGGANVRLFDGAADRFLAVDVLGADMISISCAAGGICNVYRNGILAGPMNLANNITADNAPVYIGGQHTGTQFVLGNMKAALIINRATTATEHALLYAELEALTWPTKGKVFGEGDYGNELYTDGDMEAVGVAAWSVGGGATLTKQTGNVLGGSQVLRIASAASYGAAYQTLLTIGSTYRLTGWGRGDATSNPSVKHGGDYAWIGTPATAWQYFDVIFVTTTAQLGLFKEINGGAFVEFDNISVREVDKTQTQFKTDWGAKIQSNRGGADQIIGTDFWVNSGNIAVVSDTIEGESVKAFECVAGGGFQVAATEFSEDATQACYGTWQLWFNKDPTLALSIGFAVQDTGLAVGYGINLTSDERIQLGENGGPTLLFQTSPSYFTTGVWHKLRITRSQLGEFTVYLNDVLVDPTGGAGTNPVTNTDETTASYIAFALATGNKIALSSVNGNYALSKQQGVIIP